MDNNEILEKIGKIKNSGIFVYKRQYCGCICTDKFDRIFYCDGNICYPDCKKLKISDTANDIEWYIDVINFKKGFVRHMTKSFAN